MVNVSGDANLLTVETPDAILVTGDRNEVAWSGARSPRVTNTGRQNRIGPERPQRRHRDVLGRANST